jgi:hypothetical protein
MFRSFDKLPDEVTGKTSEQLLNSPRASRPDLLRQQEGGAFSLFDSSSLADHFNQYPDGRRTSQEIEAAKLGK